MNSLLLVMMSFSFKNFSILSIEINVLIKEVTKIVTLANGVDVSKYTPIVFDSSAPAGAVHPFFTKSLHPESFIAYWKKHNIWDQVFQTSVIDLEEGEQ